MERSLLLDDNAKELSGRPVIVTGAGQGLGRAYAHAIARAGGKLVINDVNEANAALVASEARALGAEAVTCGVAVGSEASATELINTCIGAFGSVYGLINNAATLHEALSVDELPERVENMVRTNILGTWYSGVAAIAQMQRQGKGVIINVSSGAMLGVSGLAIYGATKAAAYSLTLSWAKELEGTDIRVNCISPWALTPMLMTSSKDKWAKHGPEVAAPLAAYLLSDHAATLHGQIIRTAEGEISVFVDGHYGPVLGRRLDWTSETLHSVLGKVVSGNAKGFVPQNANR